ncbi:hypothetical protein HGRIS_006873 [Hohenbuehelia grisea]|uniref:Nudix hydrolase domain-containing protein n=1 Tax=Hohenbuehelia grisea TaxID=104357 RepID=A0ABR3JAC5_9AGAR
MCGLPLAAFNSATQCCGIQLCYETKRNFWFLPKGRKDIGETLETAALREAYEESGYRAEFLPLYNPTHQPPPPGTDLTVRTKNTEAIYISTLAWGPRYTRDGRLYDRGGEYLTHWYVGQIPGDAVRHEGTGMPDEQDYISEIITFEEALQKDLASVEERAIRYAWALWQDTKKVDQQIESERRAHRGVTGLSTTLTTVVGVQPNSTG